jgi:indole-3-acetate monooxygenase
MTAPTQQDSSRPDLLTIARNIGAELRSHAREGESLRRLPPVVVERLTSAGLFRLSVPARFGGPELGLLAQLEIIETISQGDGASGWCVMIASTTGLVAGSMGDDAVREVFGAGAPVCGVYAPRGKAVPVEGGYRVSGRWPFASGSDHSAWRAGGAFVMGDAGPRMKSDGKPEFRLFFFRAQETELLDTWHVCGLRGTGSHDMTTENVFVPEHRAIDLSEGPRREGSLYAFPLYGFLAAQVAAVALGIARAAIVELCNLAGDKTPAEARRKLAERPLVQREVAVAEARVNGGRAFLHQTVAAMESHARAGKPFDVRDRAMLRLAANHATTGAAEAVSAMYHAGGGSSIYEDNPLQRHFRDVHTTTQHMMVSSPVYEVVGRTLLGLPVDASQL